MNPVKATVASEEESSIKPLPTGDALKAALAPYTTFAAPLVLATSKVCELAKTDPLSDKEKEGGEMAFSALLYQYGASLDAKVLVALWIAGISTPRLLQYLDRKLDEKKAAKKQLHTSNP